MEDIITQLQALQTADDTQIATIIAALQALPTGTTAPTATSVTITFSDGSTQTVSTA